MVRVQEPFASLLKGDVLDALAGGEHAIRVISLAQSSNVAQMWQCLTPNHRSSRLCVGLLR